MIFKFNLVIINLVALRTIVHCFNFEDRDPLIKKPPANQIDSYFGFSVAQHRSTNKSVANSVKDGDVNWLLVGAPLGQNLQPGSNHSGALFKCPVSYNDDDCEQVETDGRRDASGRYILEDFDYGDEESQLGDLNAPGADEIKTGQWLGVTVRSQRPGGIVMVCAHRYIQSPDLLKFHYGQGLCYLLDANLTVYETVQHCKGRPVEKLHQQFGFCQIGTSVSFVGENFALIGAPGPFTWRGTVFGQAVDVNNFLLMDKTVYHGPLSDTEEIEKYSYLGMSVGGGHFISKDVYTYVSGAPRSNMTGQVYFFEKKFKTEDLNISLVISGEQFGSSFGYEILTVDVNNDGFDDLLVGAPFYYSGNKGGAVYIYYDVKRCIKSPHDNCTWDKVLHGKSQSRFGFSMSSLGDINKDGYNDVAIGAPYEDDHGAVYIYLGSKGGLNEEPSQVIRIKQLNTFGYSMSGGLDMDNNGYPDLLVGAYESERVLLFKTRPIIDIRIDIKGSDFQNINTSRKGCLADSKNLNYTCFSFESCFSIVGNINNYDNFNVQYHVQEVNKFAPRIWFHDRRHPDKRSAAHTKVISVDDNSKEYCQKELVYLKNDVSDILSPILFHVNYTLENNKYHSPILNKTSFKSFEATFQRKCGEDDICESYMVVTAGTNLTRNADGVYKVDKVDQDLYLQVNITNSKEPAYEAKLFIKHSSDLSYVKLQDNSDTKCSVINQTLINCEIGNPFQGTLNLTIRFEIIKDTKEQQLQLEVFVNSTSVELSKETSQMVDIILQKVATFNIKGHGTSTVFYGGHIVGESALKYLEDIGNRVIHKYEVDNSGQWIINDVNVNILWPLQVSTGPNSVNRPGKWLLYLESVPEVNGIDIEGYCEVLDRSKVNELNLTHPKIIEESENKLKTNESHSRSKRDVNYVVPTKTIMSLGKNRKYVEMNCLSGSAKCVKIVCTIRKININGSAVIEIKSRLWNSTLVEDYSNVDWVAIKSYAEVDIGDKTFNISSKSQYDSCSTLAYPQNILQDVSVDWWIIGGAITAGLLLLFVLIVILYRCGFFKRKRISKDPTLSGNLQKKGESDHLLTEK